MNVGVWGKPRDPTNILGIYHVKIPFELFFYCIFFFLKQVICKEGKKVILKFISSGVFETVYDNVVK